MIELIRQTIVQQYEAALWMLNECIEKCPEGHWDSLIARYPFWEVAYHTLCFNDLYLSPSETVYQPRPEFHPQGWDEFNAEHPSRRFERSELLKYLQVNREKLRTAVAAETEQSLAGPSGFKRQNFPRVELFLYNLRHIQHHTGQLTASLRRVNVEIAWGFSGWK